MRRKNRRGSIFGITTIDASTVFRKMVDTRVVFEQVLISLLEVHVTSAFSQRKSPCCRSKILMI
jgi:hypothetical protein